MKYELYETHKFFAIYSSKIGWSILIPLSTNSIFLGANGHLQMRNNIIFVPLVIIHLVSMQSFPKNNISDTILRMRTRA